MNRIKETLTVKSQNVSIQILNLNAQVCGFKDVSMDQVPPTLVSRIHHPIPS
jgi:hypothetical protein